MTEFYTVSVKNETSNYPFGGEGPVPYYYKSQELYSEVVLNWGLIYLILFLTTSWAIMKQKNKTIKVAFILTVFLVILDIIQGYY
ncbi:hypothetical protein GCM10023115_24840 [Pontixanthobacter gangjinensis]|uniref:Uncharacterized protein n=1 Tax=Christiangramia aestuarii TaxID=1028746 RepID=A0A7K1LSV8_9FLAO|nr:hypothetical protein [Christiangramia aestuarii]MUP43883.1 hypothetical protein [Christiangramia aestuarii]